MKKQFRSFIDTPPFAIIVIGLWVWLIIQFLKAARIL